MAYLRIGKVCVLGFVCSFFFGSLFAYTPNQWDQDTMKKIDKKIEQVSETGGKGPLVYTFSALLDQVETKNISNERTLYIIEYILRTLEKILKETYDVTLTWTPLVVGELASKSDQPQESEAVSMSGSSVVSDITSRELEDFYATYKGQVTSTKEISDLCTTYYEQIDAVAKKYDFPTALIVATWHKEHTCIFDNPSNGRGNFQITSHSYPPGPITWADFENQIVNFIIFSQAKRKRYDSFQKYGPEPIVLTYNSIDLTSLRKHAILYNGIRGTLEDNVYANENFGQAGAGGRDGIVALTIRALGWQLYKTRDLGGVTTSEPAENTPDTSNQENLATSGGCAVFTENLGPDANHPQVLALQKFLQDRGLYTGTPNGTYDDKTTEAVNAFQALHKKDILDPGGFVAPTGYWYTATRKKANEIVCG